ncbi:hypothetical protein SAICODRAFT_30793 [Saitoella complicata NRRL Y-17804]|uniref:SnoaL-like domain-containing protein n=1 Tax=Saitoella complicata (strain BCRC 22490 / CBS 7301 / JCM 7358 / NBRC 10748 / NRRL Y-17804) TaxID=698492 RepID=A0A0E9NPE9_SAICN|nr:uncharacterized protein SAICODRAFT_30793 [Saitoella complicata NRRL Y-17804]ODQ52338.1 hypothetical protein SAICODRAFT_30793 [Saitoella complicata NRRL Y-17804]GAO51709.1 hypothetical protein G7K_5802-t1 [Saitoella complicata NRRL Y-17804]
MQNKGSRQQTSSSTSSITSGLRTVNANIPDRLLSKEGVTARNKAVYQRYIDYWNNGVDSDEIYGLIHPDHRQVHHTFTGIGVEHKRSGITYFWSRFSKLRIEVLSQVADGDQIISFLVLHGIQQGEHVGHPDMERVVHLRSAFRDRFLDGKIRETEIITDFEAFRKVPWVKKDMNITPSPKREYERVGLSVVAAEWDYVAHENPPGLREGAQQMMYASPMVDRTASSTPASSRGQGPGQEPKRGCP